MNIVSWGRRHFLFACIMTPWAAHAQFSRATFTRKMNTKADWTEFMAFLDSHKDKDFELDIIVPENTTDVLPQLVDGRFAGFIMADQNLVLIATNGASMVKGQPTKIRGVFKVGNGGKWYGYKKMFLSHVRDI